MSSVCEISHWLPTTRVSSLSSSSQFLHNHTDAIRIHHFGFERLLLTCWLHWCRMAPSLRLAVMQLYSLFTSPSVELSENLTNSLTAGHQKPREWRRRTLRAHLEDVWAHWSRSGIPRLQLWNNRVQQNYLSREGETGGGKKKKKNEQTTSKRLAAGSTLMSLFALF